MRRVKNVAAIFFFACMLGFAPIAHAAQATKTGKSPGTAAKSSKRVAVTYKKNRNGAKKSLKPVKAAAAAAAVPAIVEINNTHAASGPDLKSNAALVFDAEEGTILYGKNIDQVSAIASITKLMTAMVVLDAELPLDEPIRIDKADIDTLKHTGSRLRVGSVFSRRDLLHMALMSSENRAAAALGRTYPGGTDAFVARMNAKAHELGMHNTRFAEPTGLSSQNVSTAEDLAKLVRESLDYPLIREFTTTPTAQIHSFDNGHVYGFSNSNGLVRASNWQIDVSKTGYIAEAGQCLVMQARILGRPIIIVLLDSWGKYTRIGDANRIRKWLKGGVLLAGNSS